MRRRNRRSRVASSRIKTANTLQNLGTTKGLVNGMLQTLRIVRENLTDHLHEEWEEEETTRFLQEVLDDAEVLKRMVKSLMRQTKSYRANAKHNLKKAYGDCSRERSYRDAIRCLEEEYEESINEDNVDDAYQMLQEIMEEQEKEYGQMDFPQAQQEASSYYDLNYAEDELLTWRYDNE